MHVKLSSVFVSFTVLTSRRLHFKHFKTVNLLAVDSKIQKVLFLPSLPIIMLHRLKLAKFAVFPFKLYWNDKTELLWLIIIFFISQQQRLQIFSALFSQKCKKMCGKKWPSFFKVYHSELCQFAFADNGKCGFRLLSSWHLLPHTWCVASSLKTNVCLCGKKKRGKKTLSD